MTNEIQDDAVPEQADADAAKAAKDAAKSAAKAEKAAAKAERAAKEAAKAAAKAIPAPISPINDVVLQREMLTEVAKAGRYITYGDMLKQLGYSFTRPKMRALCHTLAEVDRQCVADGEPELAVLVVREDDKLPGQGWWTANPVVLRDYLGPWEGREAGHFIRAQQALAYAHWKGR